VPKKVLEPVVRRERNSSRSPGVFKPVKGTCFIQSARFPCTKRVGRDYGCELLLPQKIAGNVTFDHLVLSDEVWCGFHMIPLSGIRGSRGEFPVSSQGTAVLEVRQKNQECKWGPTKEPK